MINSILIDGAYFFRSGKTVSIPDIVTTDQFGGDITIYSTCDAVNLNIKIDGGAIYDSKIYTYKNKACVPAVRTLIENFYSENMITELLQIKVTASDDDTQEYFTTYIWPTLADFNSSITPNSWILNNFLSPVDVKIIPYNAYDILYWILKPGDTNGEKIHITYTASDGTQKQMTIDNSDSSSESDYFATMMFVRPKIYINAVKNIDADATLNSFTILIGDRARTYYIDYNQANLAFHFANSFNCVESIFFNALTKKVAQFDRQETKIGGATANYDFDLNTTYQSEISNLTDQQMDLVNDFLFSRFVYYNNPKSPGLFPTEQVIISDITCEKADDDSKLNSVKFSWKFAQQPNRLSFNNTDSCFKNPFATQYV
jgi:hypothetical protein